MNKNKILLVVMVVLATNILTFFTARAIGTEAQAPVEEVGEEAVLEDLTEDFQLFQEIVGILEAEHLQEIDRNKLLHGAFEGMLETLDDPEASYLDREDYENLRVQTEGVYGGIGIEVFLDDEYVTIVSPISGTPGEEAGLSSGDRIVSVDGINLVGEDLNKAVSLMRGEPGTDVEMEVERLGVDEALKFEITREEIELETVEHEMLDDRLGLIRLSNFSDTTAQEFEAAIEDLKQQDMEALIIDLRNNPGGLLDAAVQIANILVPEGPITHLEGRDSRLETKTSGSEGLGIPMAALVNEASSSASEVLAGALQDTDSATIIGTRTFGKASVQNIRPLSDGGALRYTVAQYQTPDGRTIHEEGLEPDLEVKPSPVVELAMEPISTGLVEGDEGEEVETLQKLLAEFGYFDEDVSGNFDQATREALEQFQEEQGLHVTGEMGEMVVRKFHEEIETLREEDDRKLDRAVELLEDQF